MIPYSRAKLNLSDLHMLTTQLKQIMPGIRYMTSVYELPWHVPFEAFDLGWLIGCLCAGMPFTFDGSRHASSDHKNV